MEPNITTKWLEETVMGHGSIGLLQARFLSQFHTCFEYEGIIEGERIWVIFLR